MIIRMLKETLWDSKFRRIGDEFDVPDKVGRRWCNHKIAEEIGARSGGNQNNPPKTPTVAELKEQAKQFDIEGYNKMNKDQLIIAVTEAQKASANLTLIMQDEEVVKALADLEELQKTIGKVINLDLSNAGTLTKEQLLEKITQAKEIAESVAAAEKEAEELAALKIRADALGIEGFEEMTKEWLIEAIEAAEKD